MNLTLERWQHVARVYDQAVEVDPAFRDVFLSNACANDEGLPFSPTFGSVYAPSRDGKRVLMVEVVEPDEPRLTVSVNWTLQ